MPVKSERMLEQLGITLDLGSIPEVGLLAPEIDGFGLLRPGTAVAASSNLFPRIEVEENDGKPQSEAKAGAAKAAAKALAQPTAKTPPSDAPRPAQIEFADFQKLDLRVGRVVACEPHPNADKLLRVMVDLGEGAPRQILAGMAEFYKPEDMLGRQVTVVANLAPRSMRGLESQGMILAVRREGGLELLAPTGDVPPGAKVS